MTTQLLLVAGILVFSWQSLPAQPAEIVVDGRFSDWQDRSPVYIDPQDQATGAIDFERLWIGNDDRFLFLSLVVGSGEMSLQDGPSITLYLDNDNNPSTGEPFAGMGADLVWVFGDREGTFAASGSTLSVVHDDIGLIPAPSVTANRFEFALGLEEMPRRLGPLFPADTISVAFAVTGGGDVAPDLGERIEYVVDRTRPPRLYDFDIDRELPNDLRVLSWNVERDGFFDDNRARAYGDLLAAIDPDVIGFSEIYDHSVSETLDRLETMLPSDPGEQWFGSGTGFDIVIASRYPVTRSFQLERRAAAGGYMLDLSRRGAAELFVAVAHLRCCEADFERQMQVDEMMAFIRNAKQDGTLAPDTPIVIVGDMNFVGDSRQLATLTDGIIVNARFEPSFDPDWDGTPLTDRIPLTTGVPAAYTWAGSGSSNPEDYAPGRLDFVVYSDFVIEPGAAFALETRNIPLDRLQELGLSASATVVASDHLPVVADFRGSSVTASEPFEPDALTSETSDIRSPSLFPNPAREWVTIELILDRQNRPLRIAVVDLLGREILSRTVIPSHETKHLERLYIGHLRPGVYFVHAESRYSLQTRATVLTVR